MTSKIIDNLIQNVSRETLDRFFRDLNNTFKPNRETLPQYEDDMFQSVFKLGEIPFNLFESFIICVFNVNRELAERSGKKAQYDKAKKILKDRNIDAGIFVFIGEQGNFRFSLVYSNYMGTKRDFSIYRRFTYFVSPELTNKTFIQRIGEGDFSSLESIKEAFSVEKVTKEFYKKISYWYFWACQKCRFPKDAEAQENGREIAVIRLITRMIFIWFMREMKLVPNYLFEDDFIDQSLKNNESTSSSYYLAILQNLFFATLNTKIDERMFRNSIRGHKGYNPDFGNQYKFRYQELFKKPEELPNYFGEIPFLNGGLFDCLDDKPNGIYVDGFTETNKHQPIVPTFLFFSDEQGVDLNEEFGTSDKSYRVEGLINILSTYNFTIDENTIDDKDVALDPELLGKVFENLLASFNPETSTTARKSTGSYYTPREIVNYMVEESLMGYFKKHSPTINNFEEKLDILYKPNLSENPFTPEETKHLVELVENVRIIDPAVGSGAFPMGALNKLVFILSKLDKDNSLWKQTQIEAANAISDPAVRIKVKNSIEAYFRDKDPNYGRKLFLIQKCIYGVDIQQIAVEISKLRFFISLLINETIEKNKDNLGIEPLPNLDFKIMQGNSLISDYLGVDFSIGKRVPKSNGNLKLFENTNKRLIEEFDQKKISYQTESDPKIKRVLQNDIEDILILIFEDLVKQQKAKYFQQLNSINRKYANFPNKEAGAKAKSEAIQQLAKKNDFDLDKLETELRLFTSRQRIKPFFPWELYFSEVFLEKGGFDIIIGNPPYLESRHPSFSDEEKNAYQLDIKRKWKSKANLITRGTDLLIYFYAVSLNYINKNGIVVFITQNAWLSTEYGRKFQKFLLQTTNVKKIIDSDFRYFPAGDGPNINTVISVFQGKSPNQRNEIAFIKLKESLRNIDFIDFFQDGNNKDEKLKLSHFSYTNDLVKDQKWGVLLESRSEILDLISLLAEKFKTIEEIEHSKLSYGQGLNLTKSFQVDKEKINHLNLSNHVLIPILTADDGAQFNINKTKYHLINENQLSDKEKNALEKMDIKLFSPDSTSKVPPLLIMPRGIGRHFCAYNDINCHSASFVDIYDFQGNLPYEKSLNLWLFFNSTIAWIIRETFGRKNLGGGMLKAEAIDLDGMQVYFDFKKPEKIEQVFNMLKHREALSSLEEIQTREHRLIDDIVYGALGLDTAQRENYTTILKQMIHQRSTKSFT